MRTISFRKAALLALATICAAGFTACENNDNPGDDEKEYTLEGGIKVYSDILSTTTSWVTATRKSF